MLNFDNISGDFDPWLFGSSIDFIPRNMKLEMKRGCLLELPDHPAKAYTELITQALNDYETATLSSILLESCSPDVRIVKYTYSLTSHDAQEKGVSSYQFRDIDEF
eukprot:gene18186-21163_t